MSPQEDFELCTLYHPISEKRSKLKKQKMDFSLWQRVRKRGERIKKNGVVHWNMSVDVLRQNSELMSSFPTSRVCLLLLYLLLWRGHLTGHILKGTASCLYSTSTRVIHQCLTFDLIRWINPFPGSSVETSWPPRPVWCTESHCPPQQPGFQRGGGGPSAPGAACRGPGWHGGGWWEGQLRLAADVVSGGPLLV